MIDPDMTFAGRIDQIPHDHDQAHEGTEPYLLQEIRKQRDINAVQGKRGQHHADDDFRRAFPDPGIAFPVILPHDRVHIGRDMLFFFRRRFLRQGRFIVFLTHR